MEILLVVPRYSSTLTEKFDYMFPVGLSYISAALKKAKHNVDALNLNHYPGYITDILSDKLNQKKYDFVCTGSNALGYGVIEQIVEVTKKHSSKPKMILGGPIITTMPKLIFDEFGIDYGVIGEGEETVVELIDSITKNKNLKNVKGIIFRDGNQVIITEKRDPIRNLDSIPFPDFEGLEFEKQLGNAHCNFRVWTTVLDKPRVYPLLASRSCPFQCTFCYHDSEYRKRSIENIMAEINMAVDKYDINYIIIYDDCFSFDKQRVQEFCSEIKNLMKRKEKDIKWFCQMMVRLVDPDLLYLLKDAGCAVVSYGFESFSPVVLKSMNKAIKPEQIDFAFHETVKKKMNVQATFIFGDIAETNETAEETLNWWAKNAEGQVNMSFVMAYPGSKIYEFCIQKGLIKDELFFVKERLNKYLNITDRMSDKDIESLERKISKFRIKYGKFAVPSKYDRTSLHNYDLSVKCPYCNEPIRYKNCHTEGSIMFDFEMICRKCYKKFNVVSPIRKIVMIRLYFLPILDFYTRFLNPLRTRILRLSKLARARLSDRF
jgi:anaerobic magnesium-protoporphyrin IX monomethyl ester cyclase